ncbi:MAG: tellurite resistance TerB family protein [Desulfobacteraceae bacterium]|nr:tellurite resistance TerB family protein [Desulfobacteraceae bacterium]
MFNPEKLLGGLIRGGMRRRGGIGGLGGIAKGGVALGLVGVAMEAVEHFMNQPRTASPSHTGGGAPPSPPPGTGSVSGSAASAPPPPPGSAAAPPPPPVSPETVDTDKPAQAGAVLLIRAMIAAANADGVIDGDERQRILGKLKATDLSEEEHQFIVHELLQPADLETIAAQVTSPDLAKQVYAVSVMAMDVDTDAEREYLKALTQRIGMDDETVHAIHLELGIAPL